MGEKITQCTFNSSSLMNKALLSSYQGLDVLEIMRNIHVFVSRYLYNLNNQVGADLWLGPSLCSQTRICCWKCWLMSPGARVNDRASSRIGGIISFSYRHTFLTSHRCIRYMTV